MISLSLSLPLLPTLVATVGSLLGPSSYYQPSDFPDTVITSYSCTDDNCTYTLGSQCPSGNLSVITCYGKPHITHTLYITALTAVQMMPIHTYTCTWRIPLSVCLSVSPCLSLSPSHFIVSCTCTYYCSHIIICFWIKTIWLVKT